MRQLNKCLITLWVTLSVSVGSYASNLIGHDFTGECVSEEDSMMLGMCLGYLHGIMEMQDVLVAMEQIPPLFCTPEKSNYLQAMKIIEKYMDDHPEKLHLSFFLITINSLKEAFPCEE